MIAPLKVVIVIIVNVIITAKWGLPRRYYYPHFRYWNLSLKAFEWLAHDRSVLCHYTWKLWWNSLLKKNLAKLTKEEIDNLK